MDSSGIKIPDASDIISFLTNSISIPENVELLQLLALNDPERNPRLIATPTFLSRFVPLLPFHSSLVTLLNFLLPSIPSDSFSIIIPPLLKSLQIHSDSQAIQISGTGALAITIEAETSRLAISNGIIPHIISILEKQYDDERFDDALTILFSLDVSHLNRSDRSKIASSLSSLMNTKSATHVSSQRIRLSELLRIYHYVDQEEEEEEKEEEEEESVEMDISKIAKFAVRLKRRATVAMADALLRDDMESESNVGNTESNIESNLGNTKSNIESNSDNTKDNIESNSDNTNSDNTNSDNTNTTNIENSNKIKRLRDMIRDQNDKEMELQNQILQQQFQLEKEKKRSARILSKFRDVRNAYREIKSKLVEERERNKRIVTSLRRRLNEMQPKQKNIKTNAGAILDSSRLYDAIIAQHVDGALSHKHLEQFFSVFSYTYPFAASSRREHVDRDTFKHILDGTLRANNIKCVLSLSLSLSLSPLTKTRILSSQIRCIPAQSCHSVFAECKQHVNEKGSKERGEK